MSNDTTHTQEETLLQRCHRRCSTSTNRPSMPMTATNSGSASTTVNATPLMPHSRIAASEPTTYLTATSSTSRCLSLSTALIAAQSSKSKSKAAATPAKTVTTAALSVKASSSAELPHPSEWLKQNRKVIAAGVTPSSSSRSVAPSDRHVSCRGPCCLPFDHHTAAVPSDAELQAFGALLYRQLKSREALMHMFSCGCLQDHLEMRTRAMEQRNAAPTPQPSPTPISPASTTPLPSPAASPSKQRSRRMPTPKPVANTLPSEPSANSADDAASSKAVPSVRHAKRTSVAMSATTKTKKRRTAPSVKTERSSLVLVSPLQAAPIMDISQVHTAVTETHLLRPEVPTRTHRRKSQHSNMAAHKRSQSVSMAAIAIPSVSIASVDSDASLYSTLPAVMSTMPSLNEVPLLDDEHVVAHVDDPQKKSFSRKRRDSLADLVEIDESAPALIHDFLADSADAAFDARNFNYGPDSPSTAFTSDSGLSSPSDDSPLMSLGTNRDDDDNYQSPPPFTTQSSSTWNEHHLHLMHDIELNML